MSGGNRREEHAATRHLCAACRERRARYRYRGDVRADRQHVLCFQCFRAAREQLRAWQIREGLPGGWLDLPGPEALRGRPRPALGERQLEHRRRMLANMERLAASR